MVFSPSRESLATIEYERVGLASGQSTIPLAFSPLIFKSDAITPYSGAHVELYLTVHVQRA
jgi:hypothetical protein